MTIEHSPDLFNGLFLFETPDNRTESVDHVREIFRGLKSTAVAATNDQKFAYPHAGYKLKLNAIQPACGLTQIDNAPDFIPRGSATFPITGIDCARWSGS